MLNRYTHTSLCVCSLLNFFPTATLLVFLYITTSIQWCLVTPSNFVLPSELHFILLLAL